jgi:thiamine transport system substrate-binding protein
MKKLLIVFVLLFVLLPLAAQEDDAEEVTLVTYDSFAISDETIAAFEEETGYTLRILRLEDAGIMLNQLILSKDNPLGDVVYGVDNTFLSRALNENLFMPYAADGLENVPEQFQLDAAENRATPVTYGDVCLNYDVAYFEENDLDVPESLEALTDPAYEGLLVVQNPAASSPGLAFLLTTIAVFGEAGDYTYLDFWDDLMANDTLIVDGWTEAYYGEFSAGSEDGQRPLVVSYASSPPVEVLFAEETPEEAPTGAIVADETCFRQIEFVGVLNGADNVAGAEAFVDFALSETFQEDLPLNMFVFPVNENAELPEIFQEYAAVTEAPVTVEYERIEENREDWIRAWTETVR